MTRADQNNIIIQHIQKDLQEQTNVTERVDRAFNAWFQALVGPPVPPQPPVTPAEEPK